MLLLYFAYLYKRPRILNMNIKVSASILSADFAFLGDELKRAEDSGCDMIHFDVMDGHFVPNISYGVPVLKSIRSRSRLPFDVHLMITDPLKYIDAFTDAGADHITFHEEICGDKNEVIDKILSRGITAGISVKPDTPIERVYPYLDRLFMVLVMTVEPGFGGQGFIPKTLDKISALRAEIIRRGLDTHIEVDGGIGFNTAPKVARAGADLLVSGSFLFKSEDMSASVNALRREE